MGAQTLVLPRDLWDAKASPAAYTILVCMHVQYNNWLFKIWNFILQLECYYLMVKGKSELLFIYINNQTMASGTVQVH